MDDKVFQAALAGLLHDVGKFAQRAGELGSRTWDSESERDYKYQHALYSGDFVEKYVPKQWQTGLSGPARHHRPQTHHDRVVALADHLSAGERADERKDHPKQLQSIFCGVTGLKDTQPPTAKYLPLKKLEIKREVIFPVDRIDDSYGTYEALWRDFERDAQALKSAHSGDKADPTTYLHSLLDLMQRYTWCIPSAYYRSVPDVSLYDHSRMTAALAACLVEQPEDKVQAWLEKKNQDESVALLVGGDISGVQKFIYTITSRGATSGLRGRSMYLQLLTEVTARYVLKQLGLPLTNLIYAGGGHFYLLAPIGSEKALQDAQRQISRILLHHHQGDLYLALAAETLQADEFQGKPFSEKWRSLTQKLQLAKQTQFAELGDEAKLLFEPLEHGGNDEKQCAVCQREHAEPKEKDGVKKCPVCLSFEDLGKDLREVKFFGLDEIKPADLPGLLQKPAGDWNEILGHFGFHFYVDKNAPAPGQEVIRRHWLAINDGVLSDLKPAFNQSINRRFFVNVTPTLTKEEYVEFKGKVEDLHPDSVKPFEVMAEQAQGIKRMGVLRMDVDNLGKIFSEGLGEQATLSRVANLSFAFSLFFEGWMAQLANEVNQTIQRREAKGIEERLYSIYSGGDDLFFVGSWEVMPLLAERISDDLKRYSGEHPGIHLSGGITLIDGKYPLYQAAEDAHEAEQAAKDNPGKNALHFLGATVPWAKFAEIKAQQETLVKLVETKDVPKSLLRRLNQLYTEYAQANQDMARQGQGDKVYWGPWHWHSAYSLGRLAERHKKAREEIKQIRDNLSGENFKNIEWIGLAARWAELLVRKGQ